MLKGLTLALLKLILVNVFPMCMMIPITYICHWVIKFIENFIFAEIVFKFLRNGGLAVFFRTLLSGSIVSVIVLLIYCVFSGDLSSIGSLFTSNWWDHTARCVLIEDWWKYCGIYAAVYTSYYARFVSQWSYISNLYNQIKNADISLCMSCGQNCDCNQHVQLTNCKSCAVEKLNGWKAGFIEDAETLHLVTKPLFAGVIHTWLTHNDSVVKMYKEYHSEAYAKSDDADKRYQKLLSDLRKSLKMDV